MSHDWEMSKENVVPIKKGRTVQDCSIPLKLSQNSEISFEEIIKENHGNSEGLLTAYVQYYTWIRRRAGDNRASTKALLERATNDLLRFNQLMNNIQYIKMWIEYADMVSDPNDVFSFMQSNSVGTKLALYWIAWAFVAEKAQNYQFADRIFQNGQNMNAEPKSLLSQRYQQFQRRITRKYLTAMENGETFDPPPNFSKPSGSSVPVPNSNCAPSSSLSQSSFAVFCDTNDSRANCSFSNATFAKKQCSFLANENQRLKENMGVVETWTNPVLSQTLTASSNSSGGIAIFADPECIPVSTKSSKMPPSLIPIFDDSQSSLPPSTVVNTTTVCPVTIPTTVPSPVARKEEESIPVDSGEDHTINTKLALEDIEKMFADEDFFTAPNRALSNEQNNPQSSLVVSNICNDEFVDINEYCSNRRRKFMQPSLPNHISKPQSHPNPCVIEAPDDVESPSIKRARCNLDMRQERKEQLKILTPMSNGNSNDVAQNSTINNNINLVGRDDTSLCSSILPVSSTAIRCLSEEEFFSFQKTLFAQREIYQDVTGFSLRPNQLISQLNRKLPHFSVPSVSIEDRAWNLDSVLGRGKFGIAVRLRCDEQSSSTDVASKFCVMKVDKDRFSVYWELTIHRLIQQRIFHRSEYEPWLPVHQFHLFSDCAAIILPFVGKTTLISVLQRLHESRFDIQEQEIVAAMLTKHMLHALYQLHKIDILHCDVKPDNWILQINDSDFRLFLIDFGKSRPAKMEAHEDSQLVEFFGTRTSYCGAVSAKVYRSHWEKEKVMWSYGVDYHSLCCCVHQLLHFSELKSSMYSSIEAKKRGYEIESQQGELVHLPTTVLRRYWDKRCWSQLFATLLNPPQNLMEQADVAKLETMFDSFLSSRTALVEATKKKLYQELLSSNKW